MNVCHRRQICLGTLSDRARAGGLVVGCWRYCAGLFASLYPGARPWIKRIGGLTIHSTGIPLVGWNLDHGGAEHLGEIGMAGCPVDYAIKDFSSPLWTGILESPTEPLGILASELAQINRLANVERCASYVVHQFVRSRNSQQHECQTLELGLRSTRTMYSTDCSKKVISKVKVECRVNLVQEDDHTAATYLGQHNLPQIGDKSLDDSDCIAFLPPCLQVERQSELELETSEQAQIPFTGRGSAYFGEVNDDRLDTLLPKALWPRAPSG